MFRILSSVWPLFLAFSILMVGNGLQVPLLSLSAAQVFSLTTTGLLMSVYYAGYVVSSFFTQTLVRQVGYVRAFSVLTVISSNIVLVHSLYKDSIFLWFFLRFAAGFTLSGLFIVIESWLNSVASNDTRARLIGIYMTNVYACLAIGQSFLFFINPADISSFILVSMIVSLSFIPIALGKQAQPAVDNFEAISIASLYRLVPLAVVGCFMVGMAQGAFLSMGAVYGQLLGLSRGQIGILFSLPMLAVVVTQVPMGAIADRFDRRFVIAFLSLLPCIFAGAAAIAGIQSMVLFMVLLFLYGGFSVPLYSVLLAHANDVLPSNQTLAVGARMVFIYGLGSTISPFLVGASMQAIGPAMFFMIGSLIHLFLAMFSFYRIRCDV